MDYKNWLKKDVNKIFEELKTAEGGLSKEEAEKRLKIYGFNEIKEKEVSWVSIFLRQFLSPFFYLLFIASLLAVLIGEYTDSLVILAFVSINVLLGFIQEARAHKAIALLKESIPEMARVLREGKEEVINKKFLVPGDIVLLQAGDIVPADLRIVKAENILVDESVLTGESQPSEKTSRVISEQVKEIFEAKNILFTGTAVVSGESEGVVVSTGKETVFGKIAKLVAGVSRESAYEKNILNFSRLVLRIVVITIVIVFLANLAIRGKENFFDFMIFCIALLVSIIPEALPAVVTFSLSRGALKMAKEKVVVKRLSAIEDLGNIEILCSDKTGTLTENKLQLEEIHSPDKEKCQLYALLTSSYMSEEIESVLNPFDSAIWEKSSEDIRRAIGSFKVLKEIPFEAARLRNSALLEDENGELLLIAKGAPEIILKLSSSFSIFELSNLQPF
ncbi:MAG: cation-translocating P-type ATPase, partial [Minisyncoccales bacterium]